MRNKPVQLGPILHNWSPVFPNPFNSLVQLVFELPRREPVSLRICDCSGHEVTTLINSELAPGSHQTLWNASSVPSGVYLCRLDAGSWSRTVKMVLNK